ncbi:MAG: hypothetical protein SFV52_08535 [Saprospiraceae bacterium]|nr:hypothetical protein [Saprospiraceae bacterium]
MLLFPPTSRTSSLLFLLLALLPIACDNDDDDNQDMPTDYSCIKLADENGQSLGLYGCDASSDWGSVALTPKEKALLDFESINTPPNNVADSVSELVVFPNPVAVNGVLGMSLRGVTSGQNVLLKMVIVNSSGVPLMEGGLAVKTNSAVNQSIPNIVFQTGQYYRIYYRVSTQTQPALLEGYGNFLVCKGPISVGNIESDCM